MMKRWLGPAACVAGMAILAGASTAAVNLDDAVGIWLFDEGSGCVAADSSGAGVDGTLVGGAAWVSGPFGGALEFNGSDACVETGQQLLEQVSDFTISLWMRTPGTGADRVGLVGQNDTVEFGLINPSTLQLWSEGGGGSHDRAWELADNEWHHIAGTGTAEVLRLYVDGDMTEGALATPDHGTSAFNLNIGGCGIYDGTGNWFTGGIDDVAVFHRALDASEVDDLMANGLAASLDPTAVDPRGKAAVAWGDLRRQ